MFIRSERLFLRPGWPEDWEELLDQVADESLVKNLAMAPWPYSADDARWFANQPQDQRYPHFFITLPTGAASARIIGCIGIDAREGETELGYWIGREFWGRGYASEAGRAALQVARVLGHRRISASHFVDNPASGAVLRKLGFAPTGRIVSRFSVARGCEVEAVEHVRELGAPSDCDDDPRLMRAA